MSKLTKGQRMCLLRGWKCENIYACRLGRQALRMGLKLVYKKEDLTICPAFAQMVKEGKL